MKQWQELTFDLEQELGVEVVQKWLPKMSHFDAANIYLHVQDSFQLHWFDEYVKPRLKTLLNENSRPIKVHLLTEKKREIPREEPSISFLPDPIDPEMDLSHFIPFESNKIAYELLKNGSPFNPIYLFGPKSSGKTHLLMGAALAMQKMGKKVFFVRAETFTGHVVQAIRLSQMQTFRKTYREIDALIIDDIDIFSKKAATQEEFFHTFNTLHIQGKPILISAHTPPSGLSEVEPRLISRFEWGISLEIGKGDFRAILKKKGPLSDETIEWLLTHFPEDPMLAFESLRLRAKNTPLTPESAALLLKDLLAKQKENALTPEKIVKAISVHYGIPPDDILGKSQTRSVALPRQIAMYFCRKKLKLPFQKIGQIFGKDHSTVMSSVRQIEKGAAEKTIELPKIDAP